MIQASPLVVLIYCLLVRGVLGGIVASKIAPEGSSTTDVPSGHGNATSMKFVQYQGLNTAYYEFGDPKNPTVIVTGGWPTGAESNTPVAEGLAAKGLHVVMYDQYGAGNTAKPWGPWDYSITNLANQMSAVIDAAAPNKKVGVYGGTWSVFIGSEYCCMYPDSDKISAIFAIGGPSFDLGYQALIDQTKNLVHDQQNLTKVLAQWTLLSYEEEVSVPIIPEVLALTDLPNTFETKLQDCLHALNNSDADALADILGNEVARALIYDFGDYKRTETAHGEQKYQWYIFNRLLPGLKTGKMYRQYLPVPRVKEWQMKQDYIQSDIMNLGLAERTPHLNLTYLDGGHNPPSADQTEEIENTIVEWMYEIEGA